MNPSFIEKLRRTLSGKVLENEPLARHTTWRVGGAARIFIAPTDRRDLLTALALLGEAHVPWLPLGAGSNLLVRDGGIPGAVVHTGALRELSMEEGGLVRAGGGLPLMTLIRETAGRGLAGLEALAGIPGTVGGAVAMNAGAGGQDLSGVVKSVLLAGEEGEEEWPAARLDYGYRSSALPGGRVITAANLSFRPAAPERLAEEITFRIAHRKDRQGVGAPSAGSVFKNPSGLSAWKLIDEAGLRGLTVGGAMVARKHANFIVNLGGATAGDILELIDRIREKVLKQTGIELEPEVRIVGEVTNTGERIQEKGYRNFVELLCLSPFPFNLLPLSSGLNMTREELKNKKIAVLMGGLSAEREISLRTGQAVLNALEKAGYRVSALDVDRDLAARLVEEEIEVAFIALHGRYGEDGTVQGLLEMMRIPYTGSGVLASSVAMDKVTTKKILLYHELPTPGFEVYRRGDDRKALMERCRHFPLVVKPAREGSTIGVSIVRSADELRAGLDEALRCDDLVLVEDYIKGMEITVGVLGGEALPIIQVVPKGGFYDFKAKYTGGQTEYILPAPLEGALYERIRQVAVEAFRALGCAGAARVDFMVREREFYCLEVNTIPGMTETSLLPKAAAHAGISFGELAQRILEGAALGK